MLRARIALSVAIAGCFAALQPAWAVNRLIINNATFVTSSTGNTVPVIADLDQDVYGVSLHLQYDAAKVRVTAVQAGSAITGLSPEFFDGTITNSPGRVVYGTIFDLSNPITKKLSPGAGKEVFKLTVDVVASSQTTVLMDLVNVSGNPSRLNVFANQEGAPVAPAPTLVDGTLTLTPPPLPIIDSFANNSGTAGTEFFVAGQNFNFPGLAVNVCGKPAAFNLDNPTTIRVTAPACAVGPATVQVCTQNGCDSDAAGFTYLPGPQPPTIEDVTGNTGDEGKTFFVVGQGFTSPGFSIRVCGVAATFTLLPDNETARVTAPACGTTGAWALLEACNNIGCDTRVQGFFYEAAGGTFVRGDANDDGGVDLSDAVSILGDLFLGFPARASCKDALDADDRGSIELTDAVFLLQFLFQGGANIPPPYPAEGSDPTLDALPNC